jgi:hypothetical protein
MPFWAGKTPTLRRVSALMVTRWDNIRILQKVDQYQEQYGGRELWGSTVAS